MDLLFICRDGLASSLVTNLLWATSARKAGKDAAIMLSSEALAAIANGAFLWPRELMHQTARLTIADSAKTQGLPVTLRGEARQLDVHGVVAMAAEAGVPIFADPLWTDLLGMRGKLPAGIAELEAAAAMVLLVEAKTVVGSL